MDLNLLETYRNYKNIKRCSDESLSSFLETFLLSHEIMEQELFTKYNRDQIAILHLLSACGLETKQEKLILDRLKDCNDFNLSLFVHKELLKDNATMKKENEDNDVKVEVYVNYSDNSDDFEMNENYDEPFNEGEDSSEKTNAVIISVVDKAKNSGSEKNDVVKDKELSPSNKDNDLVPCKFCGKEFTKHYVKVHMRKVHVMGRHECTICGKMIKQDTIRKHYNIHKFKQSGETYHCDQCNYSTAVLQSLNRHKINVHDPKDFHCDICTYKCSTESALRIHNKSIHTKDFLCDLCDFKCNSEYYLKVHQNNYHKETQTFPCSYCDYESSDPADMKNHMTVQHGSELPLPKPAKKPTRNYDCDICDHKANGKNALRVHKEVNHYGRTFECDRCDIKFKNKNTLTKHIEKIHLNIKHNCKFCDFVSGDKNCVKRHMMTKHPDDLIIYSCHLCNYRTEHKNLLQRHLTGKYGKHNS